MALRKSLPFKTYAHSYLPKVGQLKTLGSLSQYEKLYQLADEVPKNAKVLDWGCGNGHFSAYLKHLGLSPVSFSFEKPEFIDSSSHVMGNPDKPITLPFEDNFFDYIFSIGVLEHVHETGGSQEKSLKELRRILKPGGKFYAYHFPNKYSWIEAAANCLQSLGLHPHYTHTKKFNHKDVVQLFEDWKLLKVERYAVLPRNVWNRLPESLANNETIIKMYDVIDRTFVKFLSPVAQNYLVIAEK